ncbi:MAG: hypothetical protein JWQ44_2917 [Chthoniobacter sp.]|nr:hypothetical protein [Chthoniobacter sp.]
MARKSTITQRSFVMGELRPEFLESDDLKLRSESLRGALNTQIKGTRTVRARMGSAFVRFATDARALYEIRTDTDTVFGLIVYEDSLRVIDEDGVSLFASSAVPWQPLGRVWVETFRGDTLLGGLNGMKVLKYDGTSWSMVNFKFDDAPAGGLAQPYWVYTKGITLTPSALTGSISLVASDPVFKADHVGMRIRYHSREILITGVINSTHALGTVQSSLAPSIRLTAASMASFSVGDVVVSDPTGFTGLVRAVTATTIDIVTLTFFDGPATGDLLSGPSGSVTLTATSFISPLSSPVWDEPLIGPVHGYPRAAVSAAGRLVLVDFPDAPDVIALSSARSITDFGVGAEDDDAIVRAVGDNQPRFHRVMNAGDLVFLTDKGLYYVSLRDGGLLTPSTFNPVLFDKRGAAITLPVQIGTSIVFVEASKRAISMATLDGNIYLKWSVRTLSTLHSHLIKTPTTLGAPSSYATDLDKYLFVVNADGTMAVMSWSEDFSPDHVGFVPWATEGSYIAVTSLFGRYWVIVDRTIGGVTKRVIEKFRPAALLDCEVPYDDAVALSDTDVSLHGGGWYGGTRTVGSDGIVPETEDMPAGAMVGFPFTTQVLLWPVKHVESPYTGIVRARPVRGSVALLNSGVFNIRTNNTTRVVGGYTAGDDVSLPPPLRTRVVKFSIFGNREYPEIEITKTEPGQFEVMAATQEVTM